MAKYRKISPRIWNDAKVRELTDKGKLAFLFMLTHPTMTPFGAIRANVPGLAFELGWTPRAFSKAMQELCANGMAAFEEKANLIWFPNFLKYNRPESPNVIKSWAGAFEDLPECALRDAIYNSLMKLSESLGKSFMEAFGEAFREGFEEGMGEGLPEAFAEALPKGNGQPSRIQEQEQEQDLKTKKTPPLPPSGGSGDGENGKPGTLPMSDKPGKSAADEPGIEFHELREYWNEHMRPEGPLAGFAEYKTLKKARDGTGMSCWPGLGVIQNSAEKRKALGAWNPGYEPGLAKFLKERSWLAPMPQPRASPPKANGNGVTEQNMQVAARVLAKMQNETRGKLREIGDAK